MRRLGHDADDLRFAERRKYLPVEQLGIMEQEHHFEDWWSRTDFGFNAACPIRSSSKR
jgi:hypothetical protein